MPETVSMPSEPSERVVFLDRIHIFSGLTREQLETVADVLKEESVSAGTEIINQDSLNDSLYLVCDGKLQITRSDQETPLANLVAGDYFGEESLLVNRQNSMAAVTAVEESLLLVLTRNDFLILQKQVPIFETNLKVSVNSRKLARRTHFKWLQPEEVIYFLTLKHPFLLVKALLLPGLLALASMVGMLATWYFSLWTPSLASLWYLCLISGIGAIAWGVWNGIDWGNDYYIVTDRRVVWVEKVVGIYESRQEAPLSAVQRVNVVVDFTGQLFDFGDLVIQTIVGSTLKLHNVDHPYQAAALIDHHWKRSKENSRKMDVKEIDDTLRTRLLDGQEKPAEIKGILSGVGEKQRNPYENQRNFADLFRLRFEDQAIVTYRKHIFVLAKQTLLPSLIFLTLFGILVYELLTPSTTFTSLFKMDTGLLILLWFTFLFATVLWWIYQFLDWSNDIFQVTPDQIMDVDKTPLGQVSSDIASLENILSIEYRRKGLLELLFNYGTVFITIGGGKEMAFEDVFNPSAVQEDIERRRLEKITKKEQESIKAEQARVLEWFATYYKNEEKYRNDQGGPGNQNPGIG